VAKVGRLRWERHGASCKVSATRRYPSASWQNDNSADGPAPPQPKGPQFFSRRPVSFVVADALEHRLLVGSGPTRKIVALRCFPLLTQAARREEHAPTSHNRREKENEKQSLETIGDIRTVHLAGLHPARSDRQRRATAFDRGRWTVMSAWRSIPTWRTTPTARYRKLAGCGAP
jgi:hypothetical protein